MPNARLHAAILRDVAARGLLREPRVVAAGPGNQASLEGITSVAGCDVHLRVVLPAQFPLRLPIVALVPSDALGFLPHVETSAICYADAEGLVWDVQRPAHVVEDALERAIAVLEDGVSGRNHADFSDEFEAHWIRLSNIDRLVSVLEPHDEVRRVVLATQKGITPWVAGCMGDLANYLNGTPTARSTSIRNILFVPLRPGTLLVPPPPGSACWTPEEARRLLLPALTDENRRRLIQLTRGGTRSYEYVIVQLPRPSGGESLFGLRFEHPGEVHPLRPGGTAMQVVPLRLERRDRAYLVERGGGVSSLAGKRALLVGCGAVGGHIPFQLAQAGVLNHTLVDHDTLTAENTFRHRLGRRHWGTKKAEALKAELEDHLPHVRVRAVTDPIEVAVEKGSVALGEFDIVVSALGNPTVELWLNEQVLGIPNGPAVLFTWVEPLGIGGHALLVTDSGRSGCFGCLYTSDEVEALTNRAAFAAPGQSFGKALTGCGSLYTPYSALDAERTALVASELVVKYLMGNEREGTLISWRGGSAVFAAQYALAPRFGLTDEKLRAQQHNFQHPCCQICGKRAAAV